MKSLIAIFVLVSVFHPGLTVQPFSDINEAIFHALDVVLRQEMRTGNPATGLPILAPFQSPNEEVSMSFGHLVDLDGELRNVRLDGLDTYQIFDVRLSLLTMRLAFDFMWPQLLATGWYNLNGRFAGLIPIYGQGNYRIDPRSKRGVHEGESRLNFNLIIIFICPRFTWLWLRRCSICGPARKSQHNPHRRSSECAVVGRKNQRLKSNIAAQITRLCIFLAGHPGRTGRRWFGRCHKQGHARPDSEAAGDSPEWNQRIRQRLFAAQNKSLPEQSHARRFNESDAIIVRVLFLFDALLLLSSVSLAATKNKNLAEKFFVINSQLFFLARSKGRWGGVTPETKNQRAADEKM